MESRELDTLLWGSLAVGEAAVAGATALKITGQQAAPGLSGTVAAMMAADTTTWVVAAILLAIMGVSTALVVGWLRRMLHPNDADGGGGSTRAYRDMEYRAAVARARRILADSLPTDTHLEDDDLVRYIGDMGKQRLYAQHEDPETTYAITRSGKTRLLVTRRVLEAPGAVLATSTKVDGIALTSTLLGNEVKPLPWAPPPVSTKETRGGSWSVVLRSWGTCSTQLLCQVRTSLLSIGGSPTLRRLSRSSARWAHRQPR